MAKTHNIDDLEEFWDRVNSIADIYYLHLIGEKESLSKKKILLSFEKVKKEVMKLTNTIDSLSEHESKWFWLGQTRFEQYVERINADPNSKEEFPSHGTASEYSREKGGGVENHNLRNIDIRNSLSVIKNYAQYGIDYVPDHRSGRKKHHSLFMLILNAQVFWVATLGRNFTFDEHNGEGITESYYFCRDLAEVLNLDVTPTQIKSQMRKVIKAKAHLSQ